MLILLMACCATRAAEPDVLVLDGTETSFMNDALKRIACPFQNSSSLDSSMLAGHRILVLSGKDLRVDKTVAKDIAAFLQNGGRVLAVGGGAKWMLDAKLFDASGYYPTGTTEHMSTFDGYHRLTFGYPGAKPADNWLAGVPMLLRATGGPLMRLGPRATSILSAGGPFSLAAFQRTGKGIALLIGADPQGGNECYYDRGKPVPKRGDELGTDTLLANALAWLHDPGCNLIPNSRFEELTDVGPDKSHWKITSSNGGGSEWQRAAAPEGRVFLQLKGTKPNATASVSSHCPIVVEGGATYQVSCRYQSTVAWSLGVRHLRSSDDDTKTKPYSITVPAAGEWGQYQAELTIPSGVHLMGLSFRLQGVGELDLDEVALRLANGAKTVVDSVPVETRLAAYRAELETFRKEFGGARELPDVRFFLFGMGQRAKFIYRDGRLLDARTGKVVKEWRIKSDIIVPPDYRVMFETADGGRISIAEDEEAVWIEEGNRRVAVEGTRAAVKLPAFAGHRYAQVLRVLHQELLVNITAAGPVPNFFVYPKPWYRDGAMMVMAFRETGNLGLIRDWILGLREPFDRNNGGMTEPDNLGQALFLVSLVSDKNHPLVPKVLAELPRFEREGPQGKYIAGKSDFAEHPVYQTKWLKYGLRALGMPDNYAVPPVADSYSALFWMDYRDAHVAGKDSDNRGAYPYLGWACDHFHGQKKSPIGNRDYPLTWEQHASQAKYAALAILDPVYAEQKLSTPHTWHAAEVFLYVLKEAGSSAR